MDHLGPSFTLWITSYTNIHIFMRLVLFPRMEICEPILPIGSCLYQNAIWGFTYVAWYCVAPSVIPLYFPLYIILPATYCAWNPSCFILGFITFTITPPTGMGTCFLGLKIRSLSDKSGSCFVFQLSLGTFFNYFTNCIWDTCCHAFYSKQHQLLHIDLLGLSLLLS